MKASVQPFLWLLFLSFSYSCAGDRGLNSPTTSDANGISATSTKNAGKASNQSSTIVETSPSPTPKDEVTFDGRNYIRRNGWKVPPRTELYKNETDHQPEQRTTKGGKPILTSTREYIYKTPWLYSQDFYLKGRGLESLKGQLKSVSFLEMSVNGKVFLYSIFTQKVVSPPQSNSNPHEDPFRYIIVDADGDGIFETLLWGEGEIVVPNWVLE